MARTTDSAADEQIEDVELGEPIYDADGTELGVIRGFDDAGFYVDVRENVERLSESRAASGEFGEAYLMWRCWNCGEMGRIQQLPEACPSCGAEREELYYWTED